ncbi:MAG: cyclophilin-like fold protein [Gemmatimonadota bacterium]|nr:cyclophilin-like fold protein [Gemmatimonadota bacterium]
MAHSIKITVGEIELAAELNDSETATRILSELPIRSGFNTWGDEIYFQIPVTAQPEDPQETVEAGDLAYWPPGKAFCIFWGPTPASQGDEIRPASPVNPVGRVLSGVEALKTASREDEISIEKSDA